MNKDKKIYGIDISKSIFDVYCKPGGYLQFTNDEKGFEKLLKILSSDALVS